MIVVKDALPPPPPFWRRLNSFFAFPFQMRPLAYGLLLSFCSLLFDAISRPSPSATTRASCRRTTTTRSSPPTA